MSRRGKGEGSIFKDNRGRWVATISIALADGRRKRAKRICRTRADAAAALEYLQREHATVHPDASTITVATWFRRWLTNRAEAWSPNTFSQYDSCYRNWIQPRLGPYMLGKLTKEHVQTALHDCAQAGAKPRLRQVIRGVIVGGLNAAVDDGLVPANVASRIPTPAGEAEPINPFTEDEVRKILNHSDGTRNQGVHDRRCVRMTHINPAKTRGFLVSGPDVDRQPMCRCLDRSGQGGLRVAPR